MLVPEACDCAQHPCLRMGLQLHQHCGIRKMLFDVTIDIIAFSNSQRLDCGLS